MMWNLRVSTGQRLNAIVLLGVCAAAACGGSADTSVFVGPSPTRCGVSVASNTGEVPASGGGGSLTITTSRECAWSAQAEVPWIALAATSGQGPAAVNFSVVPNPNGTPRRGRVVVSDQTVEVAQAAAPCRYEASPSSVNVGAAESEVSIRLTTTDGCRWTGRADVPWISGAVPVEGVGSAVVRINITPNTTQARSGTVTIGDAVVRVNQAGRADPPPPAPPSPTPEPPPPTPPPSPGPPPPAPSPSPNCSYELSRTRIGVGSTGEQVTVDVAAPAGCAWSASSPVPWIAVTDGTTGSGNGSVRVSVGTNTGDARTAAISVAGQTVTIEQGAQAPPSCSYTLAPTTRSVGREAEEFSVDVNTPASCTWSASTESPWMTVDSRTRTGSGSFQIAVAGNAGGPRTGTVRVATAAVTVHQTGGACTYTIKPTNYHAGRGPDEITVNVTAESGCTWTAATDVPWVTVAAGRSGSGSGTVRLVVEANSGAARTAVVTIAGHPFTVRQDGPCSYSIKPARYDAGRGPDNIGVDVTAPSGCTWSVRNPVTWVTVAEGREGSGNGTVRLLVEANSGAARSAQLTIAGQTFDLRQSGCTTSIKPGWYDAGRGPDDIRITVTADSGCTWTASSSVAWVTVAEGESGSGNGVVRLLVQPNSGAPRSVTLTIAGQPFALRQEGAQ